MCTMLKAALSGSDSATALQFDDLLKMILPNKTELDEATLLLIEQLSIYYHSVEEAGHDDAMLMACQYRQIN